MTAKGVKFLLNQREFHVNANKEVILSAGSIESPRLLMLSGVGPAKHLNSLNIEVIKDLPVGRTLYDHVGVIGPIFVVNKPIDNMYSLDHIINLDTFSQLSTGRGILTANGVESLVYMNSGLSDTNDVSVPDIELEQKMATVSFDTGPSLKLAYRLKTSTYDAVFRPLMNKRAFHFVPILLRPRSKGFMELRSNRSDDHPALHPNYFEDDRDLETLVVGIEEAIKIVSQKSFQKIETQLYKAHVPGCEQFEFATHDYWRCYVMHMTTSLHAQVFL
jgi:choline dehydrogenase-like flavoprotein